MKELLKKTLSEEAFRRGFTKGKFAKHLTTDKWIKIDSEETAIYSSDFKYDIETVSLYISKNPSICIFKRGEWAEVREPQGEPAIRHFNSVDAYDYLLKGLSDEQLKEACKYNVQEGWIESIVSKTSNVPPEVLEFQKQYDFEPVENNLINNNLKQKENERRNESTRISSKCELRKGIIPVGRILKVQRHPIISKN